MARVQQALVRQGKYFLPDTAPQGVNISRLKVGSTCATNQQTISCKRHCLLVGHKREAAVCVTRSRMGGN